MGLGHTRDTYIPIYKKTCIYTHTQSDSNTPGDVHTGIHLQACTQGHWKILGDTDALAYMYTWISINAQGYCKKIGDTDSDADRYKGTEAYQRTKTHLHTSTCKCAHRHKGNWGTPGNAKLKTWACKYMYITKGFPYARGHRLTCIHVHKDVHRYADLGMPGDTDILYGQST